MAVLMISHDLNLVRHFADRVGVMERGRLLEIAPTAELYRNPCHDTTRRLLASHPRRLAGEAAPAAAAPLLQASGMRCTFTIRRGWLARTRFLAVDGIDLELRRGETLGIVGESGSGKSTLGMALLRLSAAAVEGAVRFDGADLLALSAPALRGARARMQVVFQDPFASLSPRRTIAQIVGEGLEIHRPQLDAAERRRMVAAALQEVGLTAAMMARYPHEFSGGQRQRIAIARALVLQPELILLDEPTSSLDVSVQLQVLQLLAELQRRHGIAYLFISHDLAVIRAMAHRVMVMKDGKVVEAGETGAVLSNPAQPYTRRLLAASEYAELASA